jgi:hypothetical protein
MNGITAADCYKESSIIQILFGDDMKDKPDLRKMQLASYKRNHSGNHYEEMEKSKIKKEKLLGSKLDGKVQDKIKGMDLKDSSDADMEDLSAICHEMKKIRGNLKTHKKRYKSLFRDEE